MIAEAARFQLEASRFGRGHVFQVTIFHDDRPPPYCFAETQCSDPMHQMIQFRVTDAPDAESVVQRLRALLAHRGFAAGRLRWLGAAGKWQAWLDDAPSHAAAA